MKTIFGERLRQARIMKGLSLRGLSEMLDGLVSYNALSKYEKGEMMPSSNVLVALANILGRNPDFFFRSSSVSFSGLEFRKCKTKLSKTDEHRICEESRDYFERYLQIEDVLDMRTEFKNPLKGHVVSSAEDAERAAKQLRRAWKLGLAPLPNIYDMLESKGVVINETGAPKSFDGLSAMAGDIPVIVLAKHLDSNLARKRLTMIHELGHLLLETAPEVTPKETEKLMNHFAGAFLMPGRVLLERLGKKRKKVSVQEYLDLKMVFGISIAALVMRADQLGIVPKSYTKNFWMLRKKWGWDKRGEPGDDDYNKKDGEHSHRLSQMVRHALTEGMISASKAASLLNCSVYELQEEHDI